MTIGELETLIVQLLRLVLLNTLAIASLTDSLKNYTTTSSFYQVSTKVNNLDSVVKSIHDDVANLKLSLSSVNKLSSMLDTNIKDVTKGEILLYDGDRWTNIKAAGVIGGSGVSKLEDLTDVVIGSKSDKLALCWDNATSKWINYTLSGGGSGGGLDIAAMWTELAKVDATRKINASHYTDVVMLNNGTANNLKVAVLTTTGNVNMANGVNSAFNLSTSGTSINGDITATGEVTAYK